MDTEVLVDNLKEYVRFIPPISQILMSRSQTHRAAIWIYKFLGWSLKNWYTIGLSPYCLHSFGRISVMRPVPFCRSAIK